MRDPNRISKVLKELNTYWCNYPDLRLGQILSNMSYELSGRNDPFYLEDDELLEELRSENKK